MLRIGRLCSHVKSSAFPPHARVLDRVVNHWCTVPRKRRKPKPVCTEFAACWHDDTQGKRKTGKDHETIALRELESQQEGQL